MVLVSIAVTRTYYVKTKFLHRQGGVGAASEARCAGGHSPLVSSCCEFHLFRRRQWMRRMVV